MLNELLNLLRESLPDAIGGLITTAILAILGTLSVKFRKRAFYLATLTVLLIVALILIGFDFWIAILLSSAVVGTLGCGYLAFKLKRVRRYKGHNKKQKAGVWQKVCETLCWRSWALCGKQMWRYPNLRPWALIGLIIIPTFTIFGTQYLSRPPDKIIILVAEFDGLSPEKYRVTDFVIEQLTKSTQGYDDIKVVPLKQVITAQEGLETAREVARKDKARVIVWGWYSVTDEAVHTTSHIEMLDVQSIYGSSGSIADVTEADQITKPALEAETFEFQSSLSASITAGAIFATGLILYSEQKYLDALVLYGKALETLPEQDYLTNRSQILSERALAYVHLGELDDALADANQAIASGGNISESYTPYHNRGLVYFYRGEYQLALQDFERITAITDASVPLYMQGAFVTG